MGGSSAANFLMYYYIFVGKTKNSFLFIHLCGVFIVTGGNKSKLARLEIQRKRLGVQLQAERGFMGLGEYLHGNPQEFLFLFGNKFVSLAVF